MVPPSSHRSLKTSSALLKMAISAGILTKIEDIVKLAITNSQTPNLKSIESQLLKLSEAVETGGGASILMYINVYVYFGFFM